MKSIPTPLAKSILLPFDCSSRWNYSEENLSGTTALIISNKEMEDIMKIVKSLEDSGLVI